MGAPTDQCTLEKIHWGSTRTSCNPATHDRPLIQLECDEYIITLKVELDLPFSNDIAAKNI